MSPDITNLSAGVTVVTTLASVNMYAGDWLSNAETFKIPPSITLDLTLSPSGLLFVAYLCLGETYSLSE